MNDQVIWRLPEVMARTGLSRATIYHKMSLDEFPRSINLGLRSVGWISSEIVGWIQARIDESRSSDQK